jgi:hypothetical protein
MSQVVESDADTVSQRKDDDNLDEVGLFNIFVGGLLFFFYNHQENIKKAIKLIAKKNTRDKKKNLKN